MNIWITWERHRRTLELAYLLPGIKLFQLELDGPKFVRYPYLISRTTMILLRELPDVVIAQNPSVVLSLFLVILKKIVNFEVIIDAHNEGLRPYDGKYYWLLPIYSGIQKWASLTIVTNKELAKNVLENGGRPFVLEDKIPSFNDYCLTSLKGRQNIVFVYTFEKDEPYADVIQATRLIDSSIALYITGRYEKAPSDVIEQAPSNVIFTGFLPDQDYIDLLYSCDVVIDLTLMEDCLVCGAYEAVALEKPVILSDTQALRNYFSRGAVFTKNSPREIADAITYALQNKEELTREISVLKVELEEEWKKKFSKLVQRLDQLTGQA